MLTIDPDRREILFEGAIFSAPVVYTGAPDALLQNRFGKLPYRSLRFEWETVPSDSFQPAAVVAYPQHPEYIRITEYTKLTPTPPQGVSVIAKEYSLAAGEDDSQDPYYPILTPNNVEKANQYKEALSQIPSLFLCGRLAEYQYNNMDVTLEAAMECTKRLKRFCDHLPF